MANGIRTIYPHDLNEGVRFPEEGWSTYRPKYWEYINEDEHEDESANIISDKNHQALSQKFTPPKK